MSALPKPVLRGHYARYGLKGIIGGLSFGIFNASLYYFFYTIPRRKAQEEFYKNYDPDEHFKELLKYKILTENPYPDLKKK